MLRAFDLIVTPPLGFMLLALVWLEHRRPLRRRTQRRWASGPRHPRRRPPAGGVMTSVFRTLHQRGFDGVVAIGADTPRLPLAFLPSACSVLSRADVDVVAGLAHDGGYYLIALKQPDASLLREIPWSTDRVYALTMERAFQHGLRSVVLPAWRDIDTATDLDELVRELDGDGTDLPHTREQLARLGLR